MGYLVLFLPMGYYFCLVEDVTHGKLFIGIYGVLATYFSCVMIRLMLTLAPVVCIIAAIAINELLEKAGASIRQSIISLSWDVSSASETKDAPAQKAQKKDKKVQEKQRDISEIQEEKRRSKLLPLIPAAGIMVIVFSILKH